MPVHFCPVPHDFAVIFAKRCGCDLCQSFIAVIGVRLPKADCGNWVLERWTERIRVCSRSRALSKRLVFGTSLMRPLKRSTIPLVWGDFGDVRRCSMPGSVQSLSNS